MPRTDPSDTVLGLFGRYGRDAVLYSCEDPSGTNAVLHSLVLHSLAEVPAKAGPVVSPSANRTLRQPSRQKPSALACVNRMSLAPHKTDPVTRAARLFDDKCFLPAIADIREFSRIHGIKLPKKASRAASIPRVFAFIAAMDRDDIIRIVDDGAFSGPMRLAPIADAIRHRAAARSRDRHPIADPPVAGSANSRDRKDPVTAIEGNGPETTRSERLKAALGTS